MRIAAVVLCLALAGCSPAQWNEKLSTPEDRALALQAISALRSGNVSSLQPVMEPKAFSQTLAVQGEIKAQLSASGEPKLVTVSTNTTNDSGASQTVEALNYEFGSGSNWAAVQVVLKKGPKGVQIVGWHGMPATVQPTSAGDFTWSGKGLIQYLWLLAMIASTATILSAVVLAIRSPGIARRWAWITGSLFGLCQFSLNWATGAWGIRPLSVSLLGSGAFRASPFDAWVLTFSLPVVALVFLARRRHLLAQRFYDSAA